MVSNGRRVWSSWVARKKRDKGKEAGGGGADYLGSFQ